MSDNISRQNKPQTDDRLREFLRDYRPVAGVADELFTVEGDIRPVWQGLVTHLAEMDEHELANRIARADVYLRDAGIFYRHYDQDESADRDWPLSHMPVLLAQSEWAQITAGLSERADLLEHIVADVYGENTLVRDGHLPASLIAKNPEWLRPLVGVKPRSGHFLHFLAFDIGRDPNGQWWVLDDRTQAPAGIGFSLENRMATKRAFAEIYQRTNVFRLADFFQSFRDTLENLKENPESLIGLFTAGQFNDTYYEHAYIARYLGLMLLEGEDLTVRNGQLMVRTIAGFYPIDVIWRRFDAVWTDPLELEERSYLGTAGLVGAIRDGGVAMVNALGSGILETRALQAFIPKIAEVVSGEPLILSNIATWWCGQQREREYVKTNAENMLIGQAFSTLPPFEIEADPNQRSAFDQNRYSSVDQWLDDQGEYLVGQEAVTLSTTPAFNHGRLVPRPLSLRVYMARTANGWQAMPGGFARIGRVGDSTKLALQQGGSVADVWIVNESPVTEHSLLESANHDQAQQSVPLPSKAADNLYWLGRYIERSENYFRFLRAYHSRLAESNFKPSPLLEQMAGFVKKYELDLTQPIPLPVRQALMAAKASAGHVRDRFSPDGWLALNDLAKTLRRFSKTLAPGDDTAQAMGVLLRKVSGFSGLVHENMYQFTGWRFLTIGWSLERAMFITELLAKFATGDTDDWQLEMLLEVGDSTISHRRRFGAKISNETVAELLAFDPLNPRSVLHQLNDIYEHVAYLPGSGEHQLSPLQKTTLSRKTALSVHSTESLSRADWLEFYAGLNDLGAQLTETYLK